MIKEYLDKLPLSKAASEARDDMHNQLQALTEHLDHLENKLLSTRVAIDRQTDMLEQQQVYKPLRPRDGYMYAPPAAFRHLEELREAMLVNDHKRILGLQNVLAHSGYEVPTTIDEVAEVTERLETQVNTR